MDALMRKTRVRHQPLRKLLPLQRCGGRLRVPQLPRIKSRPQRTHPNRLRRRHRQLPGHLLRQRLHKLRYLHQLHHLLIHLPQPHNLRPPLRHRVGM